MAYYVGYKLVRRLPAASDETHGRRWRGIKPSTSERLELAGARAAGASGVAARDNAVIPLV